jgi:hypothetical protein
MAVPSRPWERRDGRACRGGSDSGNVPWSSPADSSRCRVWATLWAQAGRARVVGRMRFVHVLAVDRLNPTLANMGINRDRY